MKSGTSRVMGSLGVRSVDTRYEAVEEARDTILGLRDALCEHLTLERNELVLVSILQTLQVLDFDEETAGEVSRLAEKDRRPLVRAYAIYALAGRANSAEIDFLISRLLSERNPRVRIEALLALYEAGYHGVIGEIIKMMKTSHYRTQCAAINGIVELDLEQDRDSVLEVLHWLTQGNGPKAVVSTAEAALETLSESESMHGEAF